MATNRKRLVVSIALLMPLVSSAANAEDEILISRIYRAADPNDNDPDFHYYTANRAAWRTIESRKQKQSQQQASLGIHDYRFCKDDGDAFIATTKPLPGTFEMREWRWNVPGKYMYFYGRSLPKELVTAEWIPSTGISGSSVRIYVWENSAPGLTPVYASARQDYSDVYLTTSKKDHDDLCKKFKNRIDGGVVFYALPPPPPPKKK